MTIQQAIDKKYISLEQKSETEYWVIEEKSGKKVTTVSGPYDVGIAFTIDKKGNITSVML